MIVPIVLFAGLLLGGALGECDVSGLGSCDSDGTASAKLLQWATFNITAGAGLTTELVDSSCRVWKSYLECAKGKAVDTCSSSTDPRVSVFKAIQNATKDCVPEGMCWMQLYMCKAQESSYFTDFETQGNDTLPDASYCQANNRFRACMESKVSALCKAFQTDVAAADFGTRPFSRVCQENDCAALQTCINTFRTAMPPPNLNPIDANTCTLWKNFVTCSGGAVSSCSSIKPDDTATPAISDIATAVGNTCSKISGTTLYSCASFQYCTKRIEMFNPMSPNSFCPVSQIMLNCIASNVHICNVSTADALQISAHQQSLQLAATGCGRPNVNVDACPALKTCGDPLDQVLAIPAHTFMQRCDAIKTYQQCANTALQNCTVQFPGWSSFPGPKLDKLSGISSTVCTAMNGQPLASCVKFTSCIDGFTIPYEVPAMPVEPGERIIGKAWCPIMTRVVECAIFYEEECPMSASLKTSLTSAYSNLLLAGCPDQYGYEARTQTGGSSMATFSTVLLSSVLILGRL